MPFADSYTKIVYVDEDVQPTGTPDINATNLNNNEDFTKLLSTGLAAATTDLEALEATVATLQAAPINITQIAGLVPTWISNTQVQISAGSCYIPSTGEISTLSAATTISTSGLSANTWYRVYGYNVGGLLNLEYSTTASTVWAGTARQKTGDSSRRFIMSFRTDGSSNIHKFRYVNGWFQWLENANASPFLVLNNGQAATVTSVDCSAVVPPTSTYASFLFDHNGSNSVYFSPSDADFTLANGVFSLYMSAPPSGFKQLYAQMALNSSQAIQYKFSAAPTGGCYISVLGYIEPR